MKTAYALNFSRSAVAPVISAGVMIANVIWNAQNSTNGIVRNSKNGSPGSSRCRRRAGTRSRGCRSTRRSPALPNARLKTTHDPEDREDPHREEVLHEHAEHVLAPDHAAVEQRQPGRHEQHQRGRYSTQPVSPVSTSAPPRRRKLQTESRDVVSSAFRHVVMVMNSPTARLVHLSASPSILSHLSAASDDTTWRQELVAKRWWSAAVRRLRSCWSAHRRHRQTTGGKTRGGKTKCTCGPSRSTHC